MAACRARVVRDIDGTPLRLVGISLDVTERRLNEIRLELSEASLRLATEAGAVGVWEWDQTTDTLTWDDRTRAMFGISPRVPSRMADFYSGLHPKDYAPTVAAFDAALDPARRATYDVEYRAIGKEDGVVRWVAARGRGMFENGVCRRAVGAAIDITARKIAAARRDFMLALADRLRNLTDPSAIIAAAAQALGAHLGVSRVGYGQVHADDETVLLATHHAQGVAPVAGVFPISRFNQATIARHQLGETVVCNDTGVDPGGDAEVRAAIEARSFVSVPLVREGRFRASLFVTHRTPRVWSADESH